MEPINNYWTFIALRVKGHVPLSISSEKSHNNNTILTWQFDEDAEEDYEAWMRGDNSCEFGVVRAVQQAQSEVKSNVYRFK